MGCGGPAAPNQNKSTFLVNLYIKYSSPYSVISLFMLYISKVLFSDRKNHSSKIVQKEKDALNKKMEKENTTKTLK